MDRLREEVEEAGQHWGTKNSLELDLGLYRRPACPGNMQHHNQVIDVAIPSDTNIKTKDHEKLEKMWKVKVKVVPVVIGALSAITPKQEQEQRLRSLSRRAQS